MEGSSVEREAVDVLRGEFFLMFNCARAVAQSVPPLPACELIVLSSQASRKHLPLLQRKLFPPVF